MAIIFYTNKGIFTQSVLPMTKKKSPPINQFLSSQDFKDSYEIWKAKELAENMPEILAENCQELAEKLPENSLATQQAIILPDLLAELPEPSATLPTDEIGITITEEDLAELLLQVHDQRVITQGLADELDSTKSRIEELEEMIEEIKAIPSIHEHLIRSSAWKKMRDYREGKEASS